MLTFFNVSQPARELFPARRHRARHPLGGAFGSRNAHVARKDHRSSRNQERKKYAPVEAGNARHVSSPE